MPRLISVRSFTFTSITWNPGRSVASAYTSTSSIEGNGDSIVALVTLTMLSGLGSWRTISFGRLCSRALVPAPSIGPRSGESVMPRLLWRYLKIDQEGSRASHRATVGRRGVILTASQGCDYRDAMRAELLLTRTRHHGWA